MADIVDAATRSRMMAGIRGKDTRPELRLRKALHALGFRFRIHVAGLPGRPDIVLPKWRAVILVHGCFWHRHAGCRFATTPASRQEFWSRKFAETVARDRRQLAELEQRGWRIATVWECSLKADEGVKKVAESLAGWLGSVAPALELPPATGG